MNTMPNGYPLWISIANRSVRRHACSLHIHLSGIAYGPKGEKNHLVMEEADLDFRNLLRALHDSGAGAA